MCEEQPYLLFEIILADGIIKKCSGNYFNDIYSCKEFLYNIEHRICAQWIKTKITEYNLNASKISFYAEIAFPGIVFIMY